MVFLQNNFRYPSQLPVSAYVGSSKNLKDLHHAYSAGPAAVFSSMARASTTFMNIYLFTALHHAERAVPAAVFSSMTRALAAHFLIYVYFLPHCITSRVESRAGGGVFQHDARQHIFNIHAHLLIHCFTSRVESRAGGGVFQHDAPGRRRAPAHFRPRDQLQQVVHRLRHHRPVLQVVSFGAPPVEHRHVRRIPLQSGSSQLRVHALSAALWLLMNEVPL